MLESCHSHRAEGIPFDSIRDGDPGRKALAARVQGESQLLAGLRDVIFLQHKDVDIAHSLV